MKNTKPKEEIQKERDKTKNERKERKKDEEIINEALKFSKIIFVYRFRVHLHYLNGQKSKVNTNLNIGLSRSISSITKV